MASSDGCGRAARPRPGKGGRRRDQGEAGPLDGSGRRRLDRGVEAGSALDKRRAWSGGALPEAEQQGGGRVGSHLHLDQIDGRRYLSGRCRFDRGGRDGRARQQVAGRHDAATIAAIRALAAGLVRRSGAARGRGFPATTAGARGEGDRHEGHHGQQDHEPSAAPHHQSIAHSLSHGNPPVHGKVPGATPASSTGVYWHCFFLAGPESCEAPPAPASRLAQRSVLGCTRRPQRRGVRERLIAACVATTPVASPASVWHPRCARGPLGPSAMLGPDNHTG